MIDQDNVSGPAKAAYDRMSAARTGPLERARDASKLTIPALIPPDGYASGTRLPQPWQSVGARGVNTLAEKVTVALFPPNTSFQRLQPAPDIEDKDRQEIEELLRQVEEAARLHFEKHHRANASLLMKHLIVAGNVMIFFAKDTLRVFPLSTYVASRFPDGALRKAVVCEKLGIEQLTDDVRAQVAHKLPKQDEQMSKSLELYTSIEFKDGRYETYQELLGVRLSGTEGRYTKETLPWLALRMIKVEGDAYGRSYVEEYLGDLTALNSLYQSLVASAVANARTLYRVSPTLGSQALRKIANAQNLDAVSAEENQIGVVRSDKSAEMRSAESIVSVIERRLEAAFLMHSAVQRDAERVTAEEIRYMAQDIDDALGGFYSLMAVELQLPLAYLLLDATKALGPVRKVADPVIITGLEALGRGHEFMKLQTLTREIISLGQVDPVVLRRVDWNAYIERIATQIGVNTEGLLRSEEDVAAELQQEQLQALIQQLGPEAIRQLGGAAQQSQ